MGQKRLVIGLAVCCVALAPSALHAQDSQYWTNQYGTSANLLGGTVVGGATDLSSTYYNPGAMAMGTTDRVALSTDAIEYTRIKIRNAAGEGGDITSTRGGTAPKIFTLRLSSAHFVDQDQIAIAIVTRHDFKFDAETDVFGQHPILPGSELDDYAAELILSGQLYESWFGLAWSKKLDDRNVSLGASTFVVYRSQASRFQTVAQAVSPDSVGAAVILWDEYDYWNMRLQWKLGVLFGDDRRSLGVALTTPGINLFGSGFTKVNASRIELPDSTGATTSTLASNTQRDLSSSYRSPLSVAVGGKVGLGKTSLWGTAEWFNSVSQYTVLDAAPFEAQTTGRLFSSDVHGAASSVFNAGVGVAHLLENTTLYGAFTTDFSFFNNDDELSVTAWDIYHATFGASAGFGNIDFTGGLVYSFGNRSDSRLLDLNDPGSGIVPEEDERLDIRYRRLKLIFGFSVGM